MGLQDQISYRFNPNQFCPAPGQGVIALETRKDDKVVNKLCQLINHEEQTIKSSTELAFLEQVQFDCRAPLGLHAEFEDRNTLTLNAFLSNGRMDQYLEQRLKFLVQDRLEVARELAHKFIEWRNKFDTH